MEQHEQAAGLAKLHQYIERWQLVAEGEAFHTPSSWLQPVRYGVQPAMLKIAMTHDEVSRRTANAVVGWRGCSSRSGAGGGSHPP